MVVGFLAGVTAGLVTGVLVAPHKGGKSRKILKNKVVFLFLFIFYSLRKLIVESYFVKTFSSILF